MFVNSCSIFLSGLLAIHCLAGAEDTSNHGRYYAELEAFKKAPVTKLMFDEDIHPALAEIQRDMIICKNLTSFQRIVRSLFLMLDVVIVTPETMPLLYGYVDDICKKADIPVPTIFITRKDGFFNAFAQKILMSTGGILIGQKLMKETSDDALEAIVAHEIGHIKYDHVNKMLGILTVQWGVVYALTKMLKITSGVRVGDSEGDVLYKKCVYFLKLMMLNDCLSCVSAYFINKRFEKEADEFAYKTNGKARGLIEFFELLLQKDVLRDEEFVTIYNLLEQNKEQLEMMDYYSLLLRYYGAYAEHWLMELYKKVYYETFVGAHPTPQARIKAAQDYLAQQNV